MFNMNKLQYDFDNKSNMYCNVRQLGEKLSVELPPL